MTVWILTWTYDYDPGSVVVVGVFSSQAQAVACNAKELDGAGEVQSFTVNEHRDLGWYKRQAAMS